MEKKATSVMSLFLGALFSITCYPLLKAEVVSVLTYNIHHGVIPILGPDEETCICKS